MASLFKKKNFGAGRKKNNQSQDEMKEETQAMNNTIDVSMTPNQSGLSGSGSEPHHGNVPSPNEGATPLVHPVYTRSTKAPEVSTPGVQVDTLHQPSTGPLEMAVPVVSAVELQEPLVPEPGFPPAPVQERVASIDEQSPVGAQTPSAVIPEMSQQALIFPSAQQPNPEPVNTDVRMGPSMSFPSYDVQPAADQASVASIDEQPPVGAQSPLAGTPELSQQAPILNPAQLDNPEPVNADVRMRPSMSFPSQEVQPAAVQASSVNPATSVPGSAYSDQQPGIHSQPEVPLPQPLSPSTPINVGSEEEQVQPRRKRVPRQDGKVTLLAVVDQELHARVKNGVDTVGTEPFCYRTER